MTGKTTTELMQELVADEARKDREKREADMRAALSDAPVNVATHRVVTTQEYDVQVELPSLFGKDRFAIELVSVERVRDIAAGEDMPVTVRGFGYQLRADGTPDRRKGRQWTYLSEVVADLLAAKVGA